MEITFGFITATLLLLFLINWILKYTVALRDFPPGPWGLPILGYLPWLGGQPWETFIKIGEKYGGVFSLGFGPQTVVVLNDYAAVKESLIDQPKVFSGRPSMKLTDSATERKDVAFNDGPVWKRQRNLTIQCLKNMGMGKRLMESKGMELVHEIIDQLSQKEQEDVYLEPMIFHTVLKVNWHLVAGDNLEGSKVDVSEFETIVHETIVTARGDNPINAFPWLRFCPPNGFNYWKFMSQVKTIKSYLKTVVDEHLAKWTESSAFDFIDYYIAEIKRSQDSEPPYNAESLLMSIYDLFFAGVDTTMSTVSWGFLYLVHYPEVQAKIQEELDRIVGRERFPSMSDMPNLPYLEATVMEIHRLASITPLSIPHKTMDNAQVYGYTIPKGTTCFQNIYAIHRDPKLWKNPDVFDPQRFIQSNNKVAVPPYFMPFSTGPRVCLGQSLAEMELRMIFGCILHRFSFAAPRDNPTRNLDDTIAGITIKPKPYFLYVIKRND